VPFLINRIPHFHLPVSPGDKEPGGKEKNYEKKRRGRRRKKKLVHRLDGVLIFVYPLSTYTLSQGPRRRKEPGTTTGRGKRSRRRKKGGGGGKEDGSKDIDISYFRKPYPL